MNDQKQHDPLIEKWKWTEELYLSSPGFKMFPWFSKVVAFIASKAIPLGLGPSTSHSTLLVGDPISPDATFITPLPNKRVLIGYNRDRPDDMPPKEMTMSVAEIYEKIEVYLKQTKKAG